MINKDLKGTEVQVNYRVYRALNSAVEIGIYKEERSKYRRSNVRKWLYLLYFCKFTNVIRMLTPVPSSVP